MNNPMLFDCWACYGPGPAKDPSQRWTLEQLLEDLDLYGISAALVRHEQGLNYDPMHINRRLVAETAEHRDRLFPCWNAMPHQPGDFPEPDAFCAAMDQADVRAVLITPNTHGYPIHSDVLAPLAAALNSRRTLVLTTLAELGADYRNATTFCRTFADCSVIIAEATWGQWRLAVSILDACPNACLELSAFQANRAPEFLMARYGPERVLLGTGLPRRSGAAARGFVDWALGDPADVAKFAGLNLARCLNVPPPKPLALPEESDQMVVEARNGKPLSALVLDAHCHVLDDGLDGAGGRYVMLKGDSLNIVALAERMGVDVTAMMSWSGTVSMDVVAGNALLEQVVDRSPQQIIGLSSADPTHQTESDIRNVCERLHGQLGFRGLKPYTRNNVPYNDPRYAPYWEYANAHRLYGLLHTAANVGGMKAVHDLAERYPDVTFLVAHSGGSWALARQVVDVASQFPNVMAELTYTGAVNRVVEWFCEQIGPDRVLFGTDAPMRDPRPQLAWCVHTALPESQKQLIVGGNFARILRQGVLPPHKLPDVITGQL
ncbi:MAG: amidohydrolase family protein [Lentisphaerae bacterium]|jgi:predicted TIM-barrel fold metal-dependent hydrolase|nr:amidohydrolase family protein [Lentisphaerota bacterium]MBT4822925.1 amidohydrolase family protein [Lentisphaerota bacterium]MBT5608385.1 amidohydrolase family protein [Lentisphaerota bacterium]MBT7054995.1 amidohydrolase family protein [Lentisphaerota bacterium]MBT7844808.1 amidohydrolase family protein [Lentisphaerota bacterium]